MGAQRQTKNSNKNNPSLVIKIFLLFFAVAILIVMIIAKSQDNPKQYSYNTMKIVTNSDKEVNLWVAKSAEEQSLGLGKLSSLKSGIDGMIFIFDDTPVIKQCFWMKGIKPGFNLDIIFAYRGTVTNVYTDVSPDSYRSDNDFEPFCSEGVTDTVIEVAGKKASDYGLLVGSKINSQSGYDSTSFGIK